MWYRLTIKNDSFTVRNFSSTDKVLVTAYVSSQCEEVYKEVISPFEVDFEETKKFPLIDGIYKIKIEKVFNNSVIETVELTYPFYNMLLKSIITDIESVLCGCSCKDCDDCLKNEKDLLSLLVKSFSYYTLLYKYHSRFYDAVFTCLRCSIEDINNCVMINENVLGNSDTKELLKKILASFYLAFYFAESTNVEDVDYVKKKFGYDRVIKCIKATNADIECIKNQIENNMGTVNMITNVYVNKPPTRVGDITLSADNRTPTVYSLTSFSGVFEDPEGDALQAIRVDTLPAHGQLMYDTSGSGTWSLVTQGQIILAVDITAGRLKFIPPDQNTLDNTSWTYSARDTGSMQFAS